MLRSLQARLLRVTGLERGTRARGQPTQGQVGMPSPAPGFWSRLYSWPQGLQGARPWPGLATAAPSALSPEVSPR